MINIEWNYLSKGIKEDNSNESLKVINVTNNGFIGGFNKEEEECLIN